MILNVIFKDLNLIIKLDQILVNNFFIANEIKSKNLEIVKNIEIKFDLEQTF